MTKLISSWQMKVDRGPDWLFVRLIPPEDIFAADPELADRVWQLLESHFSHRLVLEMDEVPILCSQMIGQLILLKRRIAAEGGVMRLSGLNEACEDSLRLCRLEDSLQSYSCRACAVHGDLPKQPR